MSFKTEQEEFWAAEFGDEYIDRNREWKNNIPLFSRILKMTKNVNSVIEFGCNIGLNLKALNLLLPNSKLTGVEINKKASDILNQLKEVEVINQSIFNYKVEKKFDMSMIKGVLIHISPEMLNIVYEKLYQSSNRYILVAEYYNPTPVTISYRGNSDRLFKRDFVGEIMDKYPDLTLVDYGFVYHRDNNHPQDDVTWFLLEKK